MHAGSSPAPNTHPGHSIFIPGQVGERTCCWLLDTGAQRTLISEAAFKQLGSSYHLEPTPIKPIAVDGSRLNLLESALVKVTLGTSLSRSLPVLVVKNIQPDCILGMDFISSTASRELCVRRCSKTIIFDDVIVPFLHNDPSSASLACCMVPTTVIARVKSSVVIPARCTQTLAVKVQCERAQGVFEPTQEFVDRTGLLPCRVFGVSSEIGELPVRVCNLGCEPVLLYSNQSIGTFEGASAIEEDSDLHEFKRKPLGGFNIAPELQTADKERLEQLLERFADTVSTHEFDIGAAADVRHGIQLVEGAQPVRQRPRRVPLQLKRAVEQKLQQMERHGVIEQSSSPWASNLIIAKKKNNDIRICVDWRSLNSLTVKDAHPLPHLQQALDCLAGCSWFSTIDMRQGFLQVEINEADRQKTAFYTPNGLMQFRKMGFGMCNAPATYQRMMELIMSGLSWEEVVAYVDDLIIFSKTFDEHLKSIERVLARLRSSNLKLNPGKSFFAYRSVTYLGHEVSATGISPAKEKVRAILEMADPQSVEDVRRVIGMLGFYRRFVPSFATIAQPLHQLTQKSATFSWNEEHAAALKQLKKSLTQAPVLRLPDFRKELVVSCDSSATAIGGVISQLEDGDELPIAYASRTLSKAERNYSATDRELLALVWSVKQFRMYLCNVAKFRVFTDHQPIIGLLNSKEPTGRLARWMQLLQEFPMDVFYRPGKLNVVPDTLSRTTAAVTVRAGESLVERQQLDPALEAARQSMLIPGFEVPSELHQEVEGLLACGLQLSDNGELRQGHRPVIPQKMRKELLRQAHDSPSGGHLGAKKVLNQLLTRAWWPHVRQDVQNYCM